MVNNNQAIEQLTQLLTKLAIAIKKMSVADLAQIMLIEQAVQTSPWTELAYQQSLESKDAYFEIATYKNKLIGYSGMWHFVDEVHIATIATDLSMRQKGIGELLLINIIHKAINLSANIVTLEVAATNKAAIGLYTKYAFEEVGYRKKYYKNKEDALIMTIPSIKSHNYALYFNKLIKNLTKKLEKTVNNGQWTMDNGQWTVDSK